MLDGELVDSLDINTIDKLLQGLKGMKGMKGGENV
jgi:hypothetical protein